MDMEEIYLNHGQTVYRYLLCLSRNADLSEELTQETFCIAVKNINSFRCECKISVWLCQIAKHLWYKKIKEEKKIMKSKQDIREVSIEDTPPDEIMIENELKQDLYKSIQKLDNNTKEVMLLRLNGELSFKDIGNILGKSENWARNIFFRGKNKLKEEVELNEKRV